MPGAAASCLEPRSIPSLRWKASVKGVEALTDEELLLLVIGLPEVEVHAFTGPAAGVLKRAGSLRNLLDSTVRELATVRGIGKARAMRIVASVELGRRVVEQASCSGEPLRSSSDVYSRLVPRLGSLGREVFLALGLDVKGRIVCESRVAEGSVEECPIRPRDVFRGAVRSGACSCIAVHNHPSGEPAPSEHDRQLTQRLAEAGKVLGIRLLDHVIVASSGWFSFRDDGCL